MARFSIDCPLRWGDMDALGHINNTVYLVYVEQARISLYRQLDAELDDGFSSNVVLAHQEITYLRPVVFHDVPLRVDVWVSRVGTSSVSFGYEIFDGPRPAERDVVARASGTCVMYNFAQARPKPLTDQQRAALEPWTE